MKKIFLGLVLSVFLIGTVRAEDIALPKPNMTGGMPLMEALAKRQSKKVFDGSAFDNQTISDVLWAAFGISHDGDKRTIPTAKNEQNLDLYVLLSSGAYSYDAKNNKLVQISTVDFRENAGKQTDIHKKASMIIVYVEKLGDAFNKYNTGAAAQNVGLYAASKGLSSFVAGSANVKELGTFLNLQKGHQVQVIQPIGK